MTASFRGAAWEAARENVTRGRRDEGLGFGGTQRWSLRRPSALACALLGWIAAPAPAQSPSLFTTVGITTEQTRANGGIRGGRTRCRRRRCRRRARSAVARATTADDVPLRMPDTTGNQAELRRVPRPDARRCATRTRRQLHEAPLLRHHRRRLGRRRLHADVRRRHDARPSTCQFPDWCRHGGASHIAIGPLTQRWTRTGRTARRCSHLPLPGRQPARRPRSSSRSSCRRAPTGGTARRAAYLMALTLEERRRLASRCRTSRAVDRSRTTPPRRSRRRTRRPGRAERRRRLVHGRASAITLDGAATRRAAPASSRSCTGSTAARRRPTPARSTITTEGEHTLEYRAIDGAGNAETYKSHRARRSTPPRRHDTRRSRSRAARPSGWYDGAVTVRLSAGDGAGSGAARDRVPASTAATPGRAYTGADRRRRRGRARASSSARPTSPATSRSPRR